MEFVKCEAKRRLDRRVGGGVEAFGAGVHDGVGGDAAVGRGGVGSGLVLWVGVYGVLW